MLRAENLKRDKAEKASIAVRNRGFFCFISFLQTVLHSTSPSSQEILCILCSAEIVPQGKMPRIRMAEGSTPEGGGEGKCLRGEILM